MAVTGTITITTILFLYVARRTWRTPWWLLSIGAVLLLALDLPFLAANLSKLVHGDWLPGVIALIAFSVMTTWQRGRALVTARREHLGGPLRELFNGSGRTATSASSTAARSSSTGQTPPPRGRCGPMANTITSGTAMWSSSPSRFRRHPECRPRRV